VGEEYFYERGKIRILNDDVFTTGAIRPGSIDLVITSPPYNVDIQYNSHNDRGSYEEYLLFSDSWMQRCHDWLRDDGRLCLNIPLDKNKGGQQSVGADLTTIAKKAGFSYHSTIVWNEGNISRRTAWGSWLSASAPFVIAPVELIVVLLQKHLEEDQRVPHVRYLPGRNFWHGQTGSGHLTGRKRQRSGIRLLSPLNSRSGA